MDEWTKMSEMTNEELVVYAMGGCDRAIRLMMEKNEGLVVSKAKTYWEGIYATGMDKSLTQDDFIQLARIELWKAIAKFKPELGNMFSTYAGVCIDNKLKSVMRSVGSRYKQAGGELVSLDRYAGTEDQLTYRETYFDPLQHGPEEIAIRHDHSQWIFYSLLDLPRRERKYAVYRFGYPDGAAFLSLPCAREKPGAHDKAAVFEELPAKEAEKPPISSSCPFFVFALMKS